MISRNYAGEAVVLARRNYGEADRILVIYSKNFGKLHLIAKGVRKLKSKKRGHIEVFSYVKFSAVRTKGLDLITEVETLDTFGKVRSDLKKVALAYYFMEVVGKTTREDEKNEELFFVILEYLKKLKREERLKSLKNSFIKDALVILGFWPKEKKMGDPDKILEEATERDMSTSRVGKKLLT